MNIRITRRFLRHVDGINAAAIKQIKLGITAVAAITKAEATALTFREGLTSLLTMAVKYSIC